MDINRRAILGGAAALAASGSAAQASTQRIGGSRAQRRALDALEAYAEQHRADWGLPGMIVTVVDRDGFVGAIQSGWANVETRTAVAPEHLFQVGSISKMITALTAWSLIQEGKLAPDARLRDLMPDLPVQGGGEITLQHLLNHTSGLPADPPLFPEGGLWTGYAVGSRWSYSNTGYDLVGDIVARADGRSLQESIEARVLRPLGMTQSLAAIRYGDRALYAQGYEPALLDRAVLRPGPMAPAPWAEFAGGAGCVSATGGDMALFLRFLLELAQGRGGAVLADETAVRFLADPADAPGWSPGAKYGNGIARAPLDERVYLHHTGGMLSFCSSLHVDVEAGVAAFASSNVSHTLNYRPRDVTVQACRLLRAAREGEQAPAPPPTRPIVENPQLYAGLFTAASGAAFSIVAEADRIKLRHAGRDSDMQPANGSFFASADPDFARTGLVFEQENDAVVRAWAGEVEYVRDAARGYKPAAPADLQARAGTYDSDNRWFGPISVTARDGKLWLFNVEPLTLLDDGQWRPGADDWSPERIRFDGMLGGKTMRMSISGTPCWRRF